MAQKTKVIKRFHLRLPEKIYEKVNKLADDENTSNNAWISKAVIEKLKKEGKM